MATFKTGPYHLRHVRRDTELLVIVRKRGSLKTIIKLTGI